VVIVGCEFVLFGFDVVLILVVVVVFVGFFLCFSRFAVWVFLCGLIVAGFCSFMCFMRLVLFDLMRYGVC